MARKIYCFLNGKFVPRDSATISVHDCGFLRGFGVFDSLRTYQYKPFLLKEHLVRLYNGLKAAGIPPTYSIKQMDRIVHSLIRKNRTPDVLLRLIVTGGPTQSLVPSGEATTLIFADPIHRFPDWQYEKGINLKTTIHPRVIPSIKSTVYFSAVMETKKALKNGFHEIVYLDSKGAVLEGSTFNVFAVLPGPKLVTPKEDVLAGITGICVMDIAKKLKFPIVRAPLTPSILKKATEAFISSSNRELIPAVRVDGLKIGNGKPGHIRKILHAEYKNLVAKKLKLSIDETD